MISPPFDYSAASHKAIRGILPWLAVALFYTGVIAIVAHDALVNLRRPVRCNGKLDVKTEIRPA